MMLVAALLLSSLLLSAPETTNTQPTGRSARPSIFERLSVQRLEQFDRDRAALTSRLKPVASPYPLIRGTFHMHSRLSHDSQGTPAEIIAAAKATGTRIVGLTEHPGAKVDVIAENIKGWHEGIYFLAGVEKNNALFWPGREGEADLRVISHPEEVPNVGRSGFVGMEIYNTHSDAKDEPVGLLISALMLNLPAAKNHPVAAFESFLDYPTEFMARYDRLTREAPFSGIAANDSHQNQGLKVLALPEGGAEVRDATDDVVWRNDGVTGRMLLAAFGRMKTVDKATLVAEVLLDPYEISMRHVGTYLQIDEINERNIRRGLRDGRIVLAFENLAPLRGFGFWAAQDGKPAGTVGDRIPARQGLKLHAALPLEAEIRIIRDGDVLLKRQADGLTIPNLSPGVYRLEAWLTLAGESRPWIITNPIYLTDQPLKED